MRRSAPVKHLAIVNVAVFYIHKKILYKVPQEKLVDALMEEIDKL